MATDKLRSYDRGTGLCDYAKRTVRYRKIRDEILHMLLPCVRNILLAIYILFGRILFIATFTYPLNLHKLVSSFTVK